MRGTSTAERAAIDATLAEMRDLEGEDLGWRVRRLAEETHHRARRYGPRDETAAAIGDDALALAETHSDPLLRALAAYERCRLLPRRPDSIEQLGAAAVGLSEVAPEAFTDRWGVPPSDVLGLVTIEHSLVLNELGRFGDRLKVLRAGIDDPRISSYYRADCYRRAHLTLLSLRRFHDADDLLAELERRIGEMGTEGRLARARIRGMEAERRERWSAAIAQHAEAYELAELTVAKGNLANRAAYIAWRQGDPELIRRWSNRSLSTWAAVVDPTGRSAARSQSTRYLAMADIIEGDWLGGLRKVAELIDRVHPRPAPTTWTTLAEQLIRATVEGIDLSPLDSVILPTEEGGVRLTDVAAVARNAARVAPTDGPVLASRALHVVGEVCLLQLDELPDGFMEQMAEIARWHATRRKFWRAGRAHMLLARLLAQQGRLDEATEAAATAVEHWQMYRSGGSVSDEAWIVGTEHEQFVFAWELAHRSGRGDVAARVSEAVRGTAITRLLGRIESVGALAKERTEVSEELASNEHLPEAERTRQDERTTALRASEKRLIGELGFLDGLVASRPTEDLPALDDRVFVWVDLNGSRLALTAKDGERHSSHLAELSPLALRLLDQLAHPAQAQAVARTVGNRGLEAGLAELGGHLQEVLPVRSDLDNRLALSPAGRLWAVPWSALTVSGEPLLRRWNVVLSPSMRVTGTISQRDIEPIVAPIASFDAGLPGTKTERTAFGEVWAGGEVVEAFPPNSQLSGRGLLVASVHGDYGEGGFSQKLLVPQRPVSASELFGWSFPSVTVFGACWVGRVDSVTGGEPLGMAFPVLARGARTFVAGLFGIHDRATGDVLADCYRAVAAGTPILDALRAAQLARFESGDQALVDWAGLVAIGSH